MNLISKSMHAISVKELREKMPVIRSELKKGVSFLIIYKSKPIGQLYPFRENTTIDTEKDVMEDFENAAAEEWKKLPPLTKEEYDYYMSLPHLKD